MQVAIVLYPRFTSMDVIGPYEVLGRLPGAEVVFVAERPRAVTNDLGSLTIDVRAGLADVPKPDLVLIGGGPGQADQMDDGPLHQWLRSVDRSTEWTTSVCTGSLVLAGAGLLNGRRATSHWGALKHLATYGATPSKQRVVIDGKYATAAGVSAGIDLALTLSGLIMGDDVARMVQLIIEYAPEPPYGSGSVDTAPPAIYEMAVNRLSGRFSD